MQIADLSPLFRTLEVMPEILVFDFLRYAVGAGGVWLVVNRLLARHLRERKIRSSSPDGAQMGREILASLRTVAIFATVGSLVFLLAEIGAIEILTNDLERGWPWFLASIVGLIVAHDAWFYWTHRLIHHPLLFRRLHRTHHASHNPSPFTAYSFDVGEAALNAAFLPLALLIFPPVSGGALFIFLTHMILRNALGHCGFEVMPSTRGGRPLFDFMTTVTHHDLHHAQAGWNYGLYFTWWDRLMGTEHPLYREKFAAAVRRPLDGSAVAACAVRPGADARRVFILLLATTLCLFAAPPQRSIAASDAPPPPTGVWATEGHGAHVEFFPCEDGGDLCGRIVWTWDPAIEDAAREAPFLGGFQWKDGAWREGWLADPESGKTFRGEITPQADGVLRLKGCAFVFCRKQVWRRVEDIPGCRAAADAAVLHSPARPGPRRLALAG